MSKLRTVWGAVFSSSALILTRLLSLVIVQALELGMIFMVPGILNRLLQISQELAVELWGSTSSLKHQLHSSFIEPGVPYLWFRFSSSPARAHGCRAFQVNVTVIELYF